MTTGQIKKEIFEINGEEDFNRIALALFHYQKEKVPVYRQFLKLTHRDESPVTHYSQIPCLPVTLFKNHVVTDSEQLPAVFFEAVEQKVANAALIILLILTFTGIAFYVHSGCFTAIPHPILFSRYYHPILKKVMHP